MRKKVLWYCNIVVNVFADWRDEGGRLSGRHRGFRRQVVQPCRGNHSLKGIVNRDCRLQESAIILYLFRILSRIGRFNL
jgi:hypothetical protein